MRAFLLSAVFLLPLAAHATEPRSWANAGAEAVNNIDIRNNSSARSSSASASASRARATGGAATASASGAGGGNVSIQDRLQAPGLASYAAPSGPCVGVSTFGTASFAGVGGGFGRSELEDECQVREAARLLHAMGATSEALVLIRNLPSVRKAQPQQATVAAAAPAAEIVTAAAPAPAVQRPDWCDVASGPERRRVEFIRECQ